MNSVAPSPEMYESPNATISSSPGSGCVAGGTSWARGASAQTSATSPSTSSMPVSLSDATERDHRDQPHDDDRHVGGLDAEDQQRDRRADERERSPEQERAGLPGAVHVQPVLGVELGGDGGHHDPERHEREAAGGAMAPIGPRPSRISSTASA